MECGGKLGGRLYRSGRPDLACVGCVRAIDQSQQALDVLLISARSHQTEEDKASYNKGLLQNDSDH